MRALCVPAIITTVCTPSVPLNPSPSPPLASPGVRSYSLGQRLACLGVKFLEYSLAGIVCGFIGQGIANSAMSVK